VAGDPVFEQIRTGLMMSCGLVAGVTKCWGTEPATGQVLSEPTVVGDAPSFTSIDLGDMFGCGLTSDGTAYCWGANGWGQLGNGTGVSSATPVPVAGGYQFAELRASRNHACGRTADGKVYCWGDVDYPTPRLVSGETAFAKLSEGNCGLDAAGTAYCWDGDAAAPEPVAVPSYSFASLVAGDVHACGLQSDGTAYCWGFNSEGQLGTGDRTSSDTPRAVAGGLHFTSLSAGTTHTCGLATDGRVYCWGEGPLGTNTDTVVDQADAPKLVLGQE
jgi:alpha-tubulin suppressor-like RCC1 family protein